MDIENVYMCYRKAQAESKNRGYRIPKDFEKHFQTKMSQKNREALDLVSKYFQTKWTNIDPYRYFQCGFELYKSFTYTQFFEPKVMKLYIVKDKHLKRDMEVDKKSLIDSIKFVKTYMTENTIPTMSRYCMSEKDSKPLVLEHYLKEGKICSLFVVLMIKKGYLMLDDNMYSMMPYIVQNYRELLRKLDDISDFLSKIKDIIDPKDPTFVAYNPDDPRQQHG